MIRGLGIVGLGMMLQTAVRADCLPSGELQSVQVAEVVDGDTVNLRDGRRLRLLNINTPELGYNGRADDDYAREAKHQLESWLAPDHRIFIKIYGTDRYDRQLAEAYLQPDGQLIAERLLRAGLGWRILVPPRGNNLEQRDRPCLYQAEEQARRQKRGLWSQAVLQSKAATKADQGFQLIRGRIEQVAISRHSVWLDLEGDVVVHIAESDRRWFGNIDPQQWRGHTVEVRGWLRSRRPPRSDYASLLMDLRHPAMIRVLK